MIKNYIYSALCILTQALFCWKTWDMTGLLIYAGGISFCLLLLSWNALGERLVLWFVFRAQPMPEGTLMAPAVQTYLNDCRSGDYLSPQKCIPYYADSETRYFMPLSRRRVVVSLALQDELIESGPVILFRGVPVESYAPSIMLSRMVLLFSILFYLLIIRIVEVFAVLTAFLIKATCSLVMLIVSGAIFHGLSAIWNAIALGLALGSMVVKVQDLCQSVEDRLIAWLMRITATCSFHSLQSSSVVHT